MPLPYAPPPKESKVYRDLKNLKVSEVTGVQMNTLKGELYAQGVDGSEDEMRRLKLLGEVSNQQSSSGPIPGTGKIETFSQSVSSGVTYDVFTPEAGEVWELVSADYSATLSSGSLDSIQLKIKASSTECLIAENAANDSYDTFKDLFGSTIYIDENMTVAVRPNDANLTALAVNLLLIMVR